jgi:predicted aldo/keto reductase-like oxidoreductase
LEADLMVTTTPATMSDLKVADLVPLTTRVPYGSTGISVSRLCWGTGLMAVLKHNLSHEEAARILLRGLDLGVNFWDAADGYKTHPHVGHALRQVDRERVVVNSKTPSKDHAGAVADVERYLREMGTEYIDTVMLHGIQTAEEYHLRAGAMDALHKMKAAGKIRAVGISTHLGTGEIMDICATDPRVEVVLTTANIDGQMLEGDMKAHLPMIEKIHAAGKGICLMKTLAQGGLTQTPATIRQAIRFNLSLPYAHSVCVGVNRVEEVEYAVEIAAELEGAPQA